MPLSTLPPINRAAAVEADFNAQFRDTVVYPRGRAKACPLCNFVCEPAPLTASLSDDPLSVSVAADAEQISASDNDKERECKRCGLIPSKVDDLTTGPQYLRETARAWKFLLCSKMSPLIRDLADIVVSYLMWYRGPEDFWVGHTIDAQDQRGEWLLATILDIRGESILIHYDGWSALSLVFFPFLFVSVCFSVSLCVFCVQVRQVGHMGEPLLHNTRTRALTHGQAQRVRLGPRARTRQRRRGHTRTGTRTLEFDLELARGLRVSLSRRCAPLLNPLLTHTRTHAQ